MSKNTIISAIVLSIAIFSAQSPAQASINPATTGYIQMDNNVNSVKIDIGHQLDKSVAFSSGAETFQVSWSIVGAAKKVGKGVKKVGRKVGGVARAANKVIVPSEIRHGASWVYKNGKAGAKRAARLPYGKRCKPNKYLQPVCTVKGGRSGASIRVPSARVITHDHRVTTTHDHRTGVTTHDHRN